MRTPLGVLVSKSASHRWISAALWIAGSRSWIRTNWMPWLRCAHQRYCFGPIILLHPLWRFIKNFWWTRSPTAHIYPWLGVMHIATFCPKRLPDENQQMCNKNEGNSIQLGSVAIKGQGRKNACMQRNEIYGSFNISLILWFFLSRIYFSALSLIFCTFGNLPKIAQNAFVHFSQECAFLWIFCGLCQHIYPWRERHLYWLCSRMKGLRVMGQTTNSSSQMWPHLAHCCRFLPLLSTHRLLAFSTHHGGLHFSLAGDWRRTSGDAHSRAPRDGQDHHSDCYYLRMGAVVPVENTGHGAFQQR